MKVKSESEVIQSCPTLSNSMDCSLPGSSIHGIFQVRVWSGVPLPSLNRVTILIYYFSHFFFFFLHYGFNMTEDSLALTPLTLDGLSNSKEDYSATKSVLLVIPFMDHCLFMAKGFV